jgi:CobQ-like glutamine amidotransferase family enzyme
MDNHRVRIRIGHLYGDIMNTYGDWGNIVALTYRAQQRGIAISVANISMGDQFDADDYDCFFFGGGQDQGQEIVATDLPRIQESIKAAIERGVPLLAVCGGYQLLGTHYATTTGTDIPGAAILPVDTVAGNQRMMHNLVVAINPVMTIDRSQGATLVGFENHSGQTHLHEGTQALGRVIKGSGNNGQDQTEGVLYKHAIGTYLHGSCLPKNPHLADWLLGKALQSRNIEFTLDPLDDVLEWRAHRTAAALKP